ncbi:MAG: T9SS type B sorting domain-containing protein, partial [Bacteroidota bacterium]
LFAVIPAPNATVTGDAVVCQNDAPVNLTFSGSNSTPPYLFEYSINNGTSQTIQSTGTTASINIPTNLAGNFNVLLTGVSGNTNPVCPSNLNDTAIVTVRQLPSATLFTPDSLCLNDNNGVAIVTCSNGVAPYIIDYNLGNGPTLQESTNSNTLSISLPTTIPGQNTVNLLNVADGGSPSCSRNLSTNGSYFVEEVGPNFMAAPLVCPYSGNYQFLNQTLNGQSWYWDFDDGSYSFETNPFHEFVEGGIFEVTLVATSQSGCVDSISENLEVIQPYRVWIPNAFTPNGDVKNERFMPVITSVQDYSLSIYNRWGQLLFYTDDPDEGWNGQYNGRDLPEGIYVFMMTSTDLCNKQDVRRGAFTLAR